jgi:hypothetical protein
MFSETLLELYFVIYMYTHSMIILFLFGANDLELFLFERHPKWSDRLLIKWRMLLVPEAVFLSFMSDLWWTMCHWERFFFVYLGFTLSVSFDQCSIL